MVSILRNILRDQRGAALTELALVLPILVFLILGSVELGRNVLLNLKLAHVASSVADLVTRSSMLTENDVTDILMASQFIARPFEFSDQGVIIISAVGSEEDQPATVWWQRSGGGGLVHSASVGQAGTNANLPSGMTVSAGQVLIVVEVYYGYQSWLLSLVPSRTMRKAAYYRPRLGGLENIS